MKILGFTAENVKRISLVEIQPGDDHVVQITGRNGQGKTSTLDALDWLFSGGGHIQDDPIRGGENKAVIQADLGEIVVRRTINRKEGGKHTTSLTVEAANGARFSKPQQVVDSFMGALSLDPIGFLKSSPDEQFDTLRKFVPGVDFDGIARDNAIDYAKRTEVHRDIKRLQTGAAAQILPTDPSLDTPLERIDEAALLEVMTNAAQTNADIERERAVRDGCANTLRAWRDNAVTILQRIDSLREQMAALETEHRGLVAQGNAEETRIRELPPIRNPVDVSGVRGQIEKAKGINASVARREERDRMLQEAAALEWDAEALTEAMDARDKKKQDAIAAAKMPVDGLGFGDGVVLMNGHPISQASGAEELRLSVAIAMAMNPKLRVIRITDGNSLDVDGMKLLREMAEEHDFQVWIERVSNGERLGFVIEDGRVVASPGQASLFDVEAA